MTSPQSLESTAFDDQKKHVFLLSQSPSACDKTEMKLQPLSRNEIFINPSTYSNNGGGCC